MVTHMMKKELQEAFPNRGILDTKKDEHVSKIKVHLFICRVH